MKRYARAALGALLLAGSSFLMAAPASAAVGISFGFGGPGYAVSDPCDYYDFYSAPPPWGLPPDYCDYPVYSEPVFFDGLWYRGPIYYRWNHGQRLFWLHGGWRSDGWRGPRPGGISWQNRGGWNNGFRPGMGGFHGGVGNWHGGFGGWHGGVGGWHGGFGGGHTWAGGHFWSGGSHGGVGTHGGGMGGHGGFGGGHGGGHH